MFLINDTVGPCRTAAVPACETNVPADPAASVEAVGYFQLRLRDEIDYTLDFSAWIVANGSPQVTDAVWAVAASSPKTPVILDSAFSPQGKCVVVLKPGVGALIGDAYWLDCTVSLGPTTAVNPGDVALPARKIVRRIHVVVVNG